MEGLPVWGSAIPLPAVLLITLALYLLVLGIGLWIRLCLKDRCSAQCSDCCSDVSVFEQCFRLGQLCDCQLPSGRSCWPQSCWPQSCWPQSCWPQSCWPQSCSPPSCIKCDCACTCQPPECDSCNCLCFEIRIR